MRIWVEKTADGKMIQVNFQPDSIEESKRLDDLLKFEGQRLLPFKVGPGSESLAELNGHETQRWIIIT